MNSTTPILKISTEAIDYLKQFDSYKALFIGVNPHNVYEVEPKNEALNIDYFFVGGEKQITKEIKTRYELVYLDLDEPKEILNLLGPLMRIMKDGGLLAGNQYKILTDTKGDNPIKAFANRFGFKLVVEEDEKNWHLIIKPIYISFIIPAFNCARTIEETIYSIIDGNLDEGDEIVIVNDGSTDLTWRLLEGLKDQYAPIKLVAHSKNRGGAYARNTAVENAKNPLIFCLDSDNALENNGYPFAISHEAREYK